MFNKLLRLPERFSLFQIRRYAHSDKGFRVSVVGAAGGIGQPLSLLLMLNPLVSQLTLFDLKMAKGVAADVSHIDRKPYVIGHECKENLLKGVSCSDIVVVPAGIPRKPGQSRDDLFKVNAEVTAEIADAVALGSPEAFLVIITNPLNSTVPVAAEVLKKHNVYDPRRLFGVTTLDMVRSRKFVAEFMGIDPLKVKVPVVGGHSGTTIVPLISLSEPQFKGDEDDIAKLTKRIQNGGTEVLEAKDGAGSATLSMAHAGAEFVNSLLRGMSGARGVVDTAYVESNITQAKFFASSFALGPKGITEIFPMPKLVRYEEELMCVAMPQLLEDIQKGICYGESFTITKKPC